MFFIHPAEAWPHRRMGSAVLNAYNYYTICALYDSYVSLYIVVIK